MKIAPVAEVKAHLSAYIRESENGPVVITRNGKPAAILLAVTDEEEIEHLLLAYSPKMQALLGAAENRLDEEGGILHETFWDAIDAK